MMVPLGRRDGTLTFKKGKNQEIEGLLKLFQNETPFTGKLTSEGEIAFSGQMMSMTRKFSYHAHGKLDGKKLKLEIVGDNNHFIMFGEETDL